MTRNIPKSIKTISPRRKILTNHTGISSIMPTLVTAGLSPGHLSKLMALSLLSLGIRETFSWPSGQMPGDGGHHPGCALVANGSPRKARNG